MLKKSTSQNRRIEINREEGFAIPQILLLSLLLTTSLTALINSAINRYTSIKLKSLEMHSMNASYSAVSSIKSFLNNSKDRAYNYFWLAKSCSSKSEDEECPNFNAGISGMEWPGSFVKGEFNDLSSIFWPDTDWCNGTNGNNCIGRQVAPKCNYRRELASSRPLDWTFYRSVASNFIDNNDDLVGIENNYFLENQEQSFSIKSSDYVGTELAGENSFLIEGITKSLGTETKTSINKLRVNIAVTSIVPNSGFSFISAGENELDRNSLNLSNLNVVGDQSGSIIWRKNIYSSQECNDVEYLSGINQALGLPKKGGLWIQPLSIPSRPAVYRNQLGNWDLGNRVCTPNNSDLVSSRCSFLENAGWEDFQTVERTVFMNNLIVKGRNASFNISTSDQSPLTIVFSGSVDISNGGQICHRDGGSFCGSGKPENLTIIFNQSNQSDLIQKQALECSNFGGIRLNNNVPPNNTFFLGSTENSKFSGFVYALDTTFSTSSLPSRYYQSPIGGRKLLVVSKGLYSVIDDPESTNDSLLTPKIFKTTNLNYIPFQTDLVTYQIDEMRNNHIIAAGSRCETCDPPEDTMLNMALIWNSVTNNYYLRGFYYQGDEAILAGYDIGGRKWLKELGSFPLSNENKNWLDIYGIDLKETSLLNQDVTIKGVVWAKNVCLDRNKVTNWQFDNDVANNLPKRHSNDDFNYGVRYYRGRGIKVWDTLRDFIIDE